VITVRRNDANDGPLVGLLGRLTFREAFGVLFSGRESELGDYLDRTFAPMKIDASMRKAENRYWVVSVDGLPVGYGKLKLASSNGGHPAGASAQLQKIYILAEFMSQNAGSALMQTMMLAAAQAGACTVWLNVLSSNDRAIRFYERQGWARTGETHFAIGTQSLHYLTYEITV